MTSPTQPAPAPRLVPSTFLMHFAFILTGLGTLLLGPILPLLAKEWHMLDSQSGQLFLAKFCGSFLGGVLVSRHLRRTLMIGLAASTLGFGAFALAPGMHLASAGLFVGGFGLGQTITSINILAGRRSTRHRGSALALLNFSWSFGALLSPLLTAWLTPRFPLRPLLEAFAATFLIAIAILLFQLRGAAGEPSGHLAADAPDGGIHPRIFLYFAAFLFLYGGLETSLAGWLTTFALRYGNGSLAVGEYTLVLLLVGLTGGRALASLIMLKVSEQTMLRFSLGFAALFTAGVALAHSAAAIAAYAVLLGLSMAPFFPAIFSVLIAQRPSARQAGVVLALSGLGAAALPWGMGVISTRTGSLQVALILPFLAALVMLGLSFLRRPRDPRPQPTLAS